MCDPKLSSNDTLKRIITRSQLIDENINVMTHVSTELCDLSLEHFVDENGRPILLLDFEEVLYNYGAFGPHYEKVCFMAILSTMAQVYRHNRVD